jgi:hypothetical protein
MNQLFVGKTRVALLFAVAGLTCTAVAEQRTVDVSALAHCRAIPSAGERLACYDALEARAVAGARTAPAATPTDTASSRSSATGSDVQAAQAPAGAAAPSSASTVGGAAPAVAATAPGAATAAGASTVGSATPSGAAAATGSATASGAPAGGTAAAAPRSTDLDDPANFGLTPHQLRPTPQGPGQIKSVVSRMTQDRLSNVDLVLDNGQTWRLVESNPRVRPGDTVTIKRAALGSYLLVTPSRRSYRVERTN